MTWKTATHVLKHPVTIGDKTTSSVTLREPDVAALEIIGDLGLSAGAETTVRQMRGLIEALADVTPEVIGKIHRSDFAALGEILGPLLVGEQTVEVS
ncbi:tail assembly chaperone E/41/14-like protein [Ochrobactrum sp. BH3]|nr:tail assembly chaperone E/41/14-like protein [Ochrobactrum sp. BH3]